MKKIALIALALMMQTACSQDERPNFLIIIADDVGYAELGPFGGEIATPSLDALAADGLRFTSFYAQMNCSPTRAMLMSGTDSHRVGLGSMGPGIGSPNQLGQPGYEGVLNDQAVAFTELLQDAGYRNFIAGKWHLGTAPNRLPIARGFDRSFIQSGGGPGDSHFNLNGPRPDSTGSYFEDTTDVTGTAVSVDFFSSNFYADKLIEYLSENEDQDAPFLAWLAFSAPHIPVQAPDTHIDLYRGRYDAGYDVLREQRLERMKEIGIVPEDVPLAEQAPTVTPWDQLSAEAKRIQARRMEVYAGAIANMDDNIGRVIDYLKRAGDYEDTIILFMSDNGAAGFFGWGPEGGPGFGAHARADNSLENVGREGSWMFYGPGWGSAGSTPFSLFKRHATEGGIRVPAIMAGPGIDNAGGMSHTTVMASDVAPTLLELAGIENFPARYEGREILPQTGRSFSALFADPSAQIHRDDEIIGIELWGRIAIRKGPWKLLRTEPPFREDRWLLYNIEDDPIESADLSQQMPDKLAEMIAAWEQYEQQNGVILPNEVPTFVRPMWLLDGSAHPDPMP